MTTAIDTEKRVRDRTVIVDLESVAFARVARLRITPRRTATNTWTLPDVIAWRGKLYRLHDARIEHPWLRSPLHMVVDAPKGRRSRYVEADVYKHPE